MLLSALPLMCPPSSSKLLHLDPVLAEMQAESSSRWAAVQSDLRVYSHRDW